MKELNVRITFTEEVLGSQCADKEIHRTYIASKAPDAPSREDEVATLGVDAVEEKSMTIFHKYEDGKEYLYSKRYGWRFICLYQKAIQDV